MQQQQQNLDLSQQKPQNLDQTNPKISPEKKKDDELKKKQDEYNKKIDTKLMTYFGNEFFENRLEIQPKRTEFDPLELDEELDKILPKAKILRKLVQVEKKINEKVYKTRLDIQEQLLRPKNRCTGKLRTHIFAYCAKDESSDETNFFLNIQGKIIDEKNNEDIEQNHYRKFSYYFKKIQIKFEEELYPDIIWENPEMKKNNIYNNNPQMQFNPLINNNNLNNNINNIMQQNQNSNINNINNFNNINNNILLKNEKKNYETDLDGFCIKRPAKEENMDIKIYLYLSYHIQEFILTPKLSEILGIEQGTRPQILYHLWQYIKLNSLQDNENPKIVINNKQLMDIFGCEKMEISSLTSRLCDHLKTPPPILIEFNVQDLCEDYTKNQILKDIKITIDDPFCNNLLGFLSNANEENILFPKKFFSNSSNNNQTKFEKFFAKFNEIEKQYSSYVNIMKRHKYYYDFFDAYEKDPSLFISNFMIQQNELIKRMSEQTTSIAKSDYNSSQYYKDYEEILREYVDKYLAKKRQPPQKINNTGHQK